MSENSHWRNPLIPDLAKLKQILDEAYRSLREKYDQRCQLAIDKELKAQKAAIELLHDADIKPYISLGQHLREENNIAEGENA